MVQGKLHILQFLGRAIYPESLPPTQTPTFFTILHTTLEVNDQLHIALDHSLSVVKLVMPTMKNLLFWKLYIYLIICVSYHTCEPLEISGMQQSDERNLSSNWTVILNGQ